ncbi:oxidoreductase [mine drainage metagenome]|uniref:Oxidoreductase n=1 Tax=mine drainage metagenome TaxID=410659 RepID=T1CAJ5_9ZZZZ
MNREYKREEFEEIVKKFREKFSDSVISTDIIAGYHGDDGESFNETLKLLEDTRPDVVNITRFSARPFTKDYSVKTPSSDKIKSWTQSYMGLHKEIIAGNMDKLIGNVRSIMITEKGKYGTSVGRDHAYRPVVVPGILDIYSKVECELVGMGSTYLIGKII